MTFKSDFIIASNINLKPTRVANSICIHQAYYFTFSHNLTQTITCNIDREIFRVLKSSSSTKSFRSLFTYLTTSLVKKLIFLSHTLSNLLFSPLKISVSLCLGHFMFLSFSWTTHILGIVKWKKELSISNFFRFDLMILTWIRVKK